MRLLDLTLEMFPLKHKNLFICHVKSSQQSSQRSCVNPPSMHSTLVIFKYKINRFSFVPLFVVVAIFNGLLFTVPTMSS